MKHLARMIAFGGLIAAGMLAYAQQPQDNPQPQPQQQPATQPQTQSPSDVPKQAPSAETVFAALDTDHDGKLSKKNLPSYSARPKYRTFRKSSHAGTRMAIKV